MQLISFNIYQSYYYVTSKAFGRVYETLKLFHDAKKLF